MSVEAMRAWRARPGNKEKEQLRRKEYRLRCKDKIRLSRREHALRCYNLTVEQYNLLLEKQGYVCAICGTDKPGGNRHSKHFHVDHDHVTGAVRGLLCCNCNRGLGILGDNADNIKRVLVYLESHKEEYACK